MLHSLQKLCHWNEFRIDDSSRKGSGPMQRIQFSDVEDEYREKSKEYCASKVIIRSSRTYWPYLTNTSTLVAKGMSLKEGFSLREHQKQAVDTFLRNGEIISGNCKIPCAGGKTLAFLSIIAELETYALVILNNNLAVDQCLSELEKFHNPNGGVLVLDETVQFSSFVRKRPAITLSTYQRLTVANNGENNEVINLVKSLPYGVIVLDEAQTSVADNFQNVFSIPSCCIITFSATFMREDNQMSLIFDKVGPLVYEISRRTLIDAGYISDVKLIQINVPDQTSASISWGCPTRDSILVGNKLEMLLILCGRHLSERVIIFCDDLFSLNIVHKLLLQTNFASHVSGPLTMHTDADKRRSTIDQFRLLEKGILLGSRVIDCAMDIPGCNILIQISCVNKSSNQEMQRTGRIQRLGNGRHMSYSLIYGELERRNAVARQECMQKEGYLCEVHPYQKYKEGAIEYSSFVQGFLSRIEKSDFRKVQKTK